MALSDRLAIVITANGSQAVGEFNRVGRAAGQQLGKAERGSQRLGTQLTRAGAAMVTFGAVALVGLYKLAQAAEEQNRAEVMLQNTIQNMPELAGASTDAFTAQAEALMQVTVADDAAIVSMQAMLGTFHLTSSEIQRATPLVLDYARKFNMDLTQAAKQVGKALQGNIGTLQRNGVEIDANAYATDRFSAVMDALRENAGGFAEAEGATFSGRLEIMKNQLGEVAEGVGVGVVDAFSSMLGAVQGASDAFSSLDPNVQSTAGRLATYASVGLVASGGLSLIAGSVMRLIGQLKAGAAAAQTFGSWIGGLGLAGGVAAAGGLIVLGGIIQAYRQKAQRAAEMTEFFTQALEAQAAGDHDAIYQGIVDQISELTPSLERVGVSVNDVAAAVKDQGNAWEELQAKRDAVVQEFGGSESSAEAMAINDIVNQVEAMRGGYSSAQEDIQNTAEAQEALGLTTDGASAAMEAQQAVLDELSAAMEAFFTQTFGVERAQDDLAEAQDKLFQSLVENGPVMSGMGEQARANRDAFDGWSVAVGATAQAIVENGGSAAEAAAAIDGQRASLANARDMGLISADTFNRYSGILDGIRSEVTTTVSTPGAQAAATILANVRNLTNEIPREVRIALIATGVNTAITQLNTAIAASQGNQWSGGPIEGTGPKMVMAHGGEYVLSADQVDRIKRGRQSRGAKAAEPGGSGGGTVVNIYGDTYGVDDLTEKVMAGIRKAERKVAS